MTLTRVPLDAREPESVRVHLHAARGEVMIHFILSLF